MIRPRATPTVSLAKKGTLDQPWIGDVRVGVGDGSRCRSVAMARLRSSWKGSVTISTVVSPRASRVGAASARFSHESLPPAWRMSPAGIVDRPEIPVRRLGLGEAVPGLLRPRHHDGGGIVLVPQQSRLVEPGPEIRRRHPVVLGRAHHHDGRRMVGLVSP